MTFYIVGYRNVSQDEPAAADSSVRVAVSNNLNLAFILAILVGYGSGVWFFATQTNTNLNNAERQSRFEVEVYKRFDDIYKHTDERVKVFNGRLDAMDQRDQARNDAIGKLDLRLTADEKLADAQNRYLDTTRPKR